MSFIFIGAAMLLAALGFIVVPLLRNRQAHPSRDINVGLHHARLEELQADVTAGVLDEADYAAARRDLEVEFARAAAPAPAAAPAKHRWIAAVAAVVIIPCAAGLLYWHLGLWQSALYGDHSLPAMIASIRGNLKQAPDQVNGWELLGEAYAAAGKYGEAAKAYKHALTLSDGSDADLLAAYGEAQILAEPDRLDPGAGALFDRVLKLDPNNPRGLWYGGLIALHNGNSKTAITRFTRLLAQNPPAPVKQLVEQQIKAAGGTVPTEAEARAAVAAATPAGPVIAVSIGIAPKLRAQVPANATMFVFVRPQGEEGGPPLAVRRLNVGSFPVKVSLSDADAMIPGRHLKNYKRLRVVARISKSGQPLAQPGDIYGSADFAWSKKDTPLTIELNEVASKQD